MSDSRLLNLAPELLNPIITEALQFSSSNNGGTGLFPGIQIWFPFPEARTLEDLEMNHWTDSMCNPAGVLSTCKHLNEAYTAVFFASNTFTIHATNTELVGNIQGVLHAFGPENIKLIPKILVNVDISPLDPQDPDNIPEFHAPGLNPYSLSMISAISSIVDQLEEDEDGIASGLRDCKDASLRMRFKIDEKGTEKYAVVIDLHDFVGSLINEARRLRDMCVGLGDLDTEGNALLGVAHALDKAKQDAHRAR